MKKETRKEEKKDRRKEERKNINKCLLLLNTQMWTYPFSAKLSKIKRYQ